MKTACGQEIKPGDVLIAHTTSERSGEPGTVALCRVLGVVWAGETAGGTPAPPETAHVVVQGHGVTVLESSRLTATYAGRPPRADKVAAFVDEFGKKLLREMGGAA